MNQRYFLVFRCLDFELPFFLVKVSIQSMSVLKQIKFRSVWGARRRRILGVFEDPAIEF